MTIHRRLDIAAYHERTARPGADQTRPRGTVSVDHDSSRYIYRVSASLGRRRVRAALEMAFCQRMGQSLRGAWPEYSVEG